MTLGALTSLYLVSQTHQKYTDIKDSAKQSRFIQMITNGGGASQESAFINNEQYKKNKIYRYAVIYGAGSKIGRAFAKYLAQKKFGLILIDDDLEKLTETQNYLQDKVKRHMNLKLIFINPENQDSELDENKILSPLQGMSNFCIDLLINAKNVQNQDEINPKVIDRIIKRNQTALGRVEIDYLSTSGFSQSQEEDKNLEQDKKLWGQKLLQGEIIRTLYKLNSGNFSALIYLFNKLMLTAPSQALIINVERKQCKIDLKQDQDIYQNLRLRNQYQQHYEQLQGSFIQGQIQLNRIMMHLIKQTYQGRQNNAINIQNNNHHHGMQAINIEIDFQKACSDTNYLDNQICQVFHNVQVQQHDND
eukprot:403356320